MKRILCFLVPVLFVSALLHSCETEEDAFDETLLYGEWVSGTEHWKYKSDGTGTTWDTADDVSEDEGKPIKWQLEMSELTHIIVSEVTGKDLTYERFTVTELTVSTLKYKNSFGENFTFTKK